MEFAALAEREEAEEEPAEVAAQVEPTEGHRALAWRVLIPIGLLLLVGLTGILVYASARNHSKGAGGKGQAAVTTSAESMPRLDRHTQTESLTGIPGLQQGPLDSITGIGSSIRSFIWWTTVLSMVFLISSVGMLIWMARDSRNRGVESVASWITPVLLTNILAFGVYMVSRPKGQLVHCRHCNNKCLENAQSCPHCRRTKPTRKKRPRYDD
jgi:hypothetical protein